MPKILIIEDEKPLRAIIAAMLEDQGYEVLVADDGVAGLDLARQQLPDLIVSDVVMPRLTGDEVLKALRSDATTAAIPFILMTGQPDKTSMRQGMLLGADDYLPKPFVVPDLLAAVRGRLQRHQQLRQQAEAKVAQLSAGLGRTLPHELLTPLSGVLGLADLLQSACATLQPAQVFEIAALIRQSGQRLLRLVKNYLLFVDLELANQDPGRAESFRQGRVASVREIICSLAQSRAQQAARSADLVVEVADGPVAMSEDHLRKIVEELVDNAFKFSKAGTPVRLTTTSHPATWQLEIRDQGRGMTPTQIAQIGAYRQFDREKFEQQGLGLGLTIVKRLVELHGGTLALRSQAAAGTTVEIRLPAEQAQGG